MKTFMFGFSITNSSLTNYLLSICNVLAQRHRVVIVADKIESHPFPQSENLIIHRWPSARPVHFRDFVFLLRLVVRYRPRTMVSMFGAMNLFVLAGFLLRVRNRIAWNRSIYEKVREREALDRRKSLIYSISTEVFANSRATAADTVDYFKVPGHKVRVFYNAVAENPQPNRNPFPNQFLFIGRLHPIKGVETLLAAMPEILRRRPDARLKIVGGLPGGSVIGKYQEMADGLGVAAHVDFLGHKTPQEISEILGEVSFTVVPSLQEAFGMVVIESFAAGVPVVGSRVSGIAEIVREGRDGLLFEAGNPSSLAGAVLEMATNPGLRDACAIAAKARFLETFEIGKVTREVAAYLSQI